LALLPSDALLELDAVRAGYGAVRVLHGVTLRVPERRITALLGSNGAGKTTAMRSIAGLLEITGGSIRFAGIPVEGWPSNRRVEHGISLVPEGRLIFPEFTVNENLRVGAYVARVRQRADALVHRMYELFPRLAERRDQPGRTLSGGEQQMLAIARALMSEPRLLLLDEPSLGLAPQVVTHLFEAIRRIQQDGVTVLIVEQNARQVLELADYGYVLENGTLALEGPASQLASDGRVKRAYLGL
jgi:branched-chain amino acid transport system ATP-binding protein